MKRAIVVPAEMSGAPLAELKTWLGISTGNEDDLLIGLLRASLDMCEAFTGQMPLSVICEETIEASTSWQRLSTCPVRAITNVAGFTANGGISPVDADAYAIEIDARGYGHICARAPTGSRLLKVTYTSGIAENWSELPDPLRHGIIRLAAHHYRDRDATDPLSPPASVAALWRPWREVRLT